jgi:hypothetical protein
LRSRIVGSGLEIRAGRALAVLPTGRRTPGRRWLRHPGDQALADLPPPWIEALRPPPPPPPPPPIRLDHCTGRYARAALEGELHTLSGAAEGGRNHALHLAAVRLGRLVGAGLLDHAVVVVLLEHAAAEIGLPLREAGPTIRSGLSFGMHHPREVRS